MEKCTFCVQRIRGAQHEARLEDRPLRDGDVITACQQACPSGAIVFGNVNDPASRVSQAKEDHRRDRKSIVKGWRYSDVHMCEHYHIFTLCLYIHESTSETDS